MEIARWCRVHMLHTYTMVRAARPVFCMPLTPCGMPHMPPAPHAMHMQWYCTPLMLAKEHHQYWAGAEADFYQVGSCFLAAGQVT